MLELRPNCEFCDRDLAPDSTAARICSYECTFCADCVADILQDVCPNCGGGFVNRPVRPGNARREGVSREHQPASTQRVYSPYSEQQLRDFASRIKDIPTEQR